MTEQNTHEFEKLPFLKKKALKALAELKIETQLRLSQHDFLIIEKGKEQAVFDIKTQLLWYANPNQIQIQNPHTSIFIIGNNESGNILKKMNLPKNFDFLGLGNWEKPHWKALVNFAKKRSGNPWAKGKYLHLFNVRFWSVADGILNLDGEIEKYFIPIQKKQEEDEWMRSLRYNYNEDNIGLIAINDTFKHSDGLYNLLCWVKENQYNLRVDDKQIFDLNWFFMPNNLENLFKNVDYERCRLPVLDSNRFRDIHQGMWEFMILPEDVLLEQGVRARNPALDVKSGCIGIDFGTSSTVVAYEDENGRARLLRIGVDDFYRAAAPQHYENPTILEFVDFNKFLQDWTEMAYQPLVSWDDVRCSHEALQKLRSNDGNVAVVSSMLPKIKQWALREANDIRVRISDQEYGREHELAPLTLRNPVKGEKLTVSPNDPFDPIELYAWFLGLNINWRNRGIFLTYYLTFPVAYPKEVKEKILASFRRGLLRSLPETLANNGEIMEKFSVEERASEPAAYAAAAMPAHNIEPTEEGIAYAVFDFGGGTTDFDFGFYRWANEQEENEGIETVFEHFEAAGDKFLGGENLLENLAYRVFLHNLDICREKELSFTRPLDANDFSGSEMLVSKTQSAHTNMLMLMAKLRPFWESSQRENTGIFKLNLLDRSNHTVPVELSIPYDRLQEYLENRIQQGIQDFFVSMKKAFINRMPRKIHILLAGNSSRSRLVTDSFGLFYDGMDDDVAHARCDIVKGMIYDVFGETNPELISHAPLHAIDGNESVPTAKTGVALGILKLQKGSGIKVINHVIGTNDEAPFAHYVGNARRGKFNIGLQRNEHYDVWRKIGVPSENVFHLYHTQSNLALGNDMEIGHNELFKKTIYFAGNNTDKSVFVRAIKPHVIELCLALDETNIMDGNGDNIQEIVLL